jgi:hypothetical protein
MLARLICFLLGHLLRELDVREGPHAGIYLSCGKCSRCGADVLEVRDLRDKITSSSPPAADAQTVDERPPSQRD